MNTKIEFIKTNKFKHIDISFKFIKKYKRDNALNDYAICRIIGKYSNKYKTKMEMSNIKDNLYGMNVYAYQDVNVENTCLNFTYHFLNPKFGNDLNECLEYIKDTLLNPYINESIVEEFKYNYEAKIARSLDNPSRYATNSLLKIIGKDNHLKYRDIDLRYLINELSVDSIIDNYNDLICNSDLYIYVIGDVNPVFLNNEISSWFNDRDNVIEYPFVKLDIENLGLIEEEKDISQSYLRVVYNTNYSNKDDYYYKWMVADALLGASSNSLLFKEIREKNSLCYSIGSSMLKGEGLVVISSAISYKDLSKVTKLIDKCIDILINKEYDFSELEITKKLLINSLLSNNDDAKNSIDFIHTNKLLKRDYTLEDICELIDDVSVDDVSDVMKTYSRCLVYILKGIEDGNN